MEKSPESDALYRRYIELSKTASRLLLVLISIALYVSFTIYKNWDAEETARREIREAVHSGDKTYALAKVPELRRLHDSLKESLETIISIYGPVDVRFLESLLVAQGRLEREIGSVEDQSEKDVLTILDKIEYVLPIIDTPIGLKEFFTICPLVFFVISVFYWLYLRYSLDHFRSYCLRNDIHKGTEKFKHPWLYELPFKSTILKLTWQLILEVFPIWFLFLLLPLYLGVNYLHGQIPVLMILLTLPVIIHVSAFRIKLGKAARKDYWPLILGVILGLYMLFASTDVALSFRSSFSESAAILFLALYSFGFLELVLTGATHLSKMLPRLVILIPLVLLLIWFRSARNTFSEMVKRDKVRLKTYLVEVHGYIGHYKSRYRELKRMQ